ncbi:Esterase [Minicystis rosea]|nr:Esterase [Minicystis rosea]
MAAIRPPFDAELAATLQLLSAQLPTTITPEMIVPMREGMKLLNPAPEQLTRGGKIAVEERVIPGPAGAPDLTVSILRRKDAAGPAPGIFHTHGGGMIIGDRFTGIEPFLDWVEHLGVVVVTVEYRLAPEHPHPAPVEDCYAGLVWTAQNAAEIGIDPRRLVIAGGSAGGGLAAGVALMARDRRGPSLAAQLLIYPMLDDRNDTPSAIQMEGAGVWDRGSNHTGWTALLGATRGGPDVSPYAAPARAVDLSGLPPAFIEVGSAETFRDEDVAYASRIWQCGGVCELHVWPGGFHGFDALAPQAALSQAARSARLAWLRRVLGL